MQIYESIYYDVNLCSPPIIFFFFNDTATTEIYTLSLHDALPICDYVRAIELFKRSLALRPNQPQVLRSEEHTSELQSRSDLVCRLLLEKKKNNTSELAFSHKDAYSCHCRGLSRRIRVRVSYPHYKLRD